MVELMVGMMVGLFITGAVITVFVESERSFGQDERLHQMQESGRFTLRLLAGELTMAGFWGSVDAPTDSLAVTSDCGLDDTADTSLAADPWLQYSGSPATDFTCVTANADTHAVAVKRAVGTVAHDSTTGAVSADVGKAYVRGTGAGSGLIQYSTSSLPGTGERDWPFWVGIYYIGSEDISGQTGVPVLKRKVLTSAMAIQDDTGGYLVEGIQFFVVEFGVDNDDDGIADAYTASPTAAQLVDAVSARISVLARSTRPDPAYTNDKVYTVGGVVIDYSGDDSDNFYRRVFSTTVQLRNQAYRKRLTS